MNIKDSKIRIFSAKNTAGKLQKKQKATQKIHINL